MNGNPLAAEPRPDSTLCIWLYYIALTFFASLKLVDLYRDDERVRSTVNGYTVNEQLKRMLQMLSWVDLDNRKKQGH